MDIRWSIFGLSVYCKLRTSHGRPISFLLRVTDFDISCGCPSGIPILDDPLNDHIWTSAGRPIIGRTFWVEAGRSMDILTWTPVIRTKKERP